MSPPNRSTLEWTGGFLAGQLWLGTPHDGTDATQCSVWSQRLERSLDASGVWQSFPSYCGGLLGDVLLGDIHARELVVAGARGLVRMRHVASGVIPLGSGEKLPHARGLQTLIDAVGPTCAVLARGGELTGDDRLVEVALTQLRWHLRTLVRDDGSLSQGAWVDTATGALRERANGPQALTTESTWARSQAWGLLAAALGARWLPAARAEGLAGGRRIATSWLDRVPDGSVPRWDFDAPRGDPLDTSAAAIAAVALLRLAALEPHAETARSWRRAARSLLTALCRYVTPVHDNDPRPPGMLLNGCYHRPAHMAEANELIWGDFYLLEALCILSGSIDPLSG